MPSKKLGPLHWDHRRDTLKGKTPPIKFSKIQLYLKGENATEGILYPKTTTQRKVFLEDQNTKASGTVGPRENCGSELHLELAAGPGIIIHVILDL